MEIQPGAIIVVTDKPQLCWVKIKAHVMSVKGRGRVFLTEEGNFIWTEPVMNANAVGFVKLISTYFTFITDEPAVEFLRRHTPPHILYGGQDNA